LQPLRKHVENIGKDGDAQTVLFTAFDCVDDTKLMSKAFISDMIALAPTLMETTAGRRALLYPLVPTSTKHFLPATISSLRESAEKARDLGTSKKDPQIRRKEIKEYASPALMEWVEKEGEAWTRDPAQGLVLTDVMLYADGGESSRCETDIR
jgi:pumilio homology domain family member 6